MKIRLLVLPPPGYFPLNPKLTDFPLYTQLKSGSAGFTNRADIIRASCKRRPYLLKQVTLSFLFRTAIHFEMIAGVALSIHQVLKLKV